MSNKAFIGIDVSKDKFDVGVRDERGQILLSGKSYKMGLMDMEIFKKDIDTICETTKSYPIYGLEATGIYHLPLYQFLKEHNADIHLLNPLEIKKRDQRKIRKTKTDKLDALFIAEALMLRYIEHHQYRPTGMTAELREYCRIRHRLIWKGNECKIQATRNLDILCRGYREVFTHVFSVSSIGIIKRTIRKTRLFDVTKEEIMETLPKGRPKEWREKTADKILESFNDSVISPDDRDAYITELHMLIQEYELIQEQILRIEKQIEKIVSLIDTKITTIPGISGITGAVIIGEIGDINRFSNPQELVAYAGLDPSVYESGRSKRIGHISKRGSRILREALFQSAFVAYRHNPALNKFYLRLKAKDKHHKVCMVAISRKLLHIIYSVWKNNKEFTIPAHLKTESSTN